MKACSKCDESKPLDAFPSRGKSGRQSWCRECFNAHLREKYAGDAAFRQRVRERGREWSRANPEKRAAAKRRQYAARKQSDPEGERMKRRRYEARYKYGLEWGDFDALWRSQDGRCAICKSPFTGRVAVDHCHTTGKIRGLLCTRCNVGIGNMRDDPDMLQRAIDYLRAA